jgi:hypothetical protein
MLVFALASAANAVNRIQHAGGLPHQHGLFSEVLPDRDDDHHDADHDDHDLIAAGHDHDGAHHPDPHGGAKPHHHGDTGASLMVLALVPPTMFHPSEQRQSPAFARFTISVRQWLPDRPPRTTSSAI